MAIDAQVDVLKKGARAWNDWRAERPGQVPDLSGGGLRGLGGLDDDAERRGHTVLGEELLRLVLHQVHWSTSSSLLSLGRLLAALGAGGARQ